MGWPDATLGEADGDAPDLLDRPADEVRRVRVSRIGVFGGGALARRRMVASMAKASITSETCRCQPCQLLVSLWSRHGWHRHVSLAMLAFAMLAIIRYRANAPPPPKTLIDLTRTRRTSSAGRSRTSGASPCASRSDASGQPASSPGRSGDARTKPRRDAHT